MSFRDFKNWFAGLVLGAGCIAMLTILGGCGTMNGIASDIEVAARKIKEETTPYTQRSMQPRIVYATKNVKEKNHE